MTPKEKAEQLIDRFYRHFRMNLYTNADNDHLLHHAKMCAGICVSEIISEFGVTYPPAIQWFKEVKQEIENL